jgi:AcrR family transcriptional regulator
MAEGTYPAQLGISARKKTRDPAEVRRRLLDAATRRFAESGFEGVNSNQIARDAGVGVGTFYNHFQDKFEVHQAVVLDTLEALRRRVARSAARPGGGIEEQVRNLVEAVVGFAEESPAQFRVAFGPEASATRPSRAPRGENPARQPSRAQVGYSTRVTERRLAELQSDGALDARIDPAVAARAFVAMQNGVVCWWLEDPSRASRAALIETLVRLHPAVAAAIF